MSAAAAAPAVAVKVQEKTAPAANEKDAKSGPAAAVAGGGEVKGTRVFIGNLAFKTTAEELKKHIDATVACVHAEVIAYASGRSKGCGLAEFKTVADAEKAVKSLTNSELGGRKIFVREDREPKGFGKDGAPAKAAAPSKDNDGGAGRGRGRGRGGARGGGRGGRGGRGGGRGGFGGGDGGAAARAPNNDPCNLFVGNLPWATTEAELKTLFGDYGTVAKCVIQQDRNGRSKGFATVTMSKGSEAKGAIDGLNDAEVGDRKIVVRQDHYAA